MFDSILVATDGSTAASAATEHAAVLATRTDARLHAVAVVEDDDASPGQATLDGDGAQAALADAETLANGAGETIVTQLRTGPAPDAILSYVAEFDVSLLVIGASGRAASQADRTRSPAARVSSADVTATRTGDGGERRVPGSVAESVIGRAQIPVLVIGVDG